NVGSLYGTSGGEGTTAWSLAAEESTKARRTSLVECRELRIRGRTPARQASEAAQSERSSRFGANQSALRAVMIQAPARKATISPCRLPRARSQTRSKK